MLRQFLFAKIQNLRVTAKNHEYHGSQGVPRSLLLLLGLESYERVLIANKRTGQRWETYLIPCEEGEAHLNGAAAHMGEVGDELILMVFRSGESFQGARVVFCNDSNRVDSTLNYNRDETHGR